MSSDRFEIKADQGGQCYVVDWVNFGDGNLGQPFAGSREDCEEFVKGAKHVGRQKGRYTPFDRGEAHAILHS